METTIYSSLINITNEQFAIHKNSNIFCKDKSLNFSNETNLQISLLRNNLKEMSMKEIEQLSKHYRNTFVKCFCNVNQYSHFTKKEEEDIEKIYQYLLSDLMCLDKSLKDVEQAHYQRINTFIKSTNIHIYQLNHNHDELAKNFICEQYSASFLKKLLNLEIIDIQEPILDIGCGQDGKLVQYLQEQGLNAYGFDRFAQANHIYKGDWFTFSYGQKKWGLIISNLSFSSHFLYHHNHRELIANHYAKTYMKILLSLKNGGMWIYAPSIPFFEELLPEEQYKIKRIKIHEDFSKTTIIKL